MPSPPGADAAVVRAIVPTSAIVPDADNRRIAEDDDFEALCDSIRLLGILQAVQVWRRPDGTHRLIDGERRWRAAQRAGLLKVPVAIREVEEGSREKLLELALVENIQRENLNPIDEALAYQRLSDEHGLTQEQIASAVGKDRSSIANFVRLLKLPDEVRNDLAAGALSMGHARALLSLSDAAAQRQASREVISRTLSVRDTEALVKKMLAGPAASPRIRSAEPGTTEPPVKDVHTRAAEDKLRFALGTKVRIVRRGQGGSIEIDFHSEDELNRLYEQLTTNG
jgi:ParB family chromosome partitioning protein